MEVKSDFEELVERVERVERRKGIVLEDIIKVLPNSKEQIAKIYKQIGDIKKLVYLISVCDFFYKVEDVIDVVLKNIKIISERNDFKELADFKEFYFRQKMLYEGRCAQGIKHKIGILESSLDYSTSRSIGGGTPYYPNSADDNPNIHNAIRALEGD